MISPASLMPWTLVATEPGCKGGKVICEQKSVRNTSAIREVPDKVSLVVESIRTGVIEWCKDAVRVEKRVTRAVAGPSYGEPDDLSCVVDGEGLRKVRVIAGGVEAAETPIGINESGEIDGAI
jgi:hypothetical protein